ncbi:hypothetical protein [Egbenema bharatensis]|uniref:hypothetical protein n=1 Tax=Egbenema bharatensis TaxID=3463334 RepID=UPI003A887F33
MQEKKSSTANNNQTQDTDITTEDLRRLTQAPSVQPLITENEFSIEEVRSPRPRWTQPLPKFALVGTILFPVFGIVCWFVLGGGNRSPQVEAPVLNTAIAPSQTTESEEVARLQEENAKLKARMALDDQVEIEQQLRQSNTQMQPPEVETQEKSPVEPEVTPMPARTESPPRQVVYNSPSPQIQTTPAPVTRPTSVARSAAPTQLVDPMQQWQRLAQLGSYGSIRPEGITTVEFSSAQQGASQSVPGLSTLVSATSSVPIARIAPTSAVQLPSSGRVPQTRERENPPDNTLNVEQRFPDEVSQDASAMQARNLLSQTSLSVLEDAEAIILEGSSIPQSLIAGTRSPGVLLTPIVVDESEGQTQFAVILSESLIDSRGATAFPGGTQFLVQVDHISETGQVHLSATTATWDVNGHQQELILPTGVIQVRGEAGEPLMAKHYEDRGDEIAAMDAGQFLLGAIGRAAELYTRSETRIQTRGSSTVVTENNPEPNILAGLIEGGTNAILGTIQERNRRAVERLEELPNGRFVEAGTPVEIFVNQSLFMPM